MIEIWNNIRKYAMYKFNAEVQELIIFPQTFSNTAGLADDGHVCSGQALTEYLILVAKTSVGYLVCQQGSEYGELLGVYLVRAEDNGILNFLADLDKRALKPVSAARILY